MPVNLLWLPAEGQIEDGCIDPWALMELFERWGEVKSRRIAQQLWDLIETPLPMERIGRKTWAYVGLDGLRVVVT